MDEVNGCMSSTNNTSFVMRRWIVSSILASCWNNVEVEGGWFPDADMRWLLQEFILLQEHYQASLIADTNSWNNTLNRINKAFLKTIWIAIALAVFWLLEGTREDLD